MVVVVAAAAVAAGVGVYKGGKLAVAGVKKKVEDRKKTRELKQRDKQYVEQKQQVESERQTRLSTMEAMRSRDTKSRLSDTTNTTDSIKERLANYKGSIKGTPSVPSNTNRFSRFTQRQYKG